MPWKSFYYDALGYNFDHYHWTKFGIGEKSINSLHNGKVGEVLGKVGMQHCCIEWSFGHKGEEGHRLKKPGGTATHAYGEFLVVDRKVETIKVFDGGGEFIYEFNPEVYDTVTCY